MTDDEQIHRWYKTHYCAKCKIQLSVFGHAWGIYDRNLCPGHYTEFTKYMETNHKDIRWFDYYSQEHLSYGLPYFEEWIKK